jgi:heme exporter protein C
MNIIIFIKENWWKIGGIVIFIYVLTGGMLTPLKPGITNISNNTGETGSEFGIIVSGYNSNYLSAVHNTAWLKYDSLHILKAAQLEALSENQLNLIFHIPEKFPTDKKLYELTLIINNELDGTSVLPSAIFIRKNMEATGQEDIITGTWLSGFDQSLHQTTGIQFPYRNILNETIRNTFFHVAIWMAMFVLLILGVFNSFKYLSSKDILFDHKSSSIHAVAIVYGIIGLITGSIWAKFTWGTFWTTDVKLNMTAISMMIYLAYFVLRSSLPDPDKRARVSSVYAIFAFFSMIPLIFIIPRMTDSLHPGNGGNPALGGEDLDHTLRMFFYPAVIALFLLGLWMATLYYRYKILSNRILEKEMEAELEVVR